MALPSARQMLDAGRRRVAELRPTRRDVLILTAGTAFAQGVVLALAPVLTRLYTPSDIGVVTLYTSVLTILAVVASWRYELAIPLPRDDATAANLLAVSLGLVIAASGLIGIAILVAYPAESSSKTARIVGEYLWVMPLGLFGLGCYQALSYWAVRVQAYSQLAQTRVAQGVGLAGTQVGLGFAGAGALGLLIGDVVGKAAGITRLARLVVSRQESLASISVRGAMGAARRYYRFPLFSAPSGLLSVAALQLPAVFFVAIYGTVDGGWFGLAVRVSAVPLAVIGQAVMQVYVGRAGAILRSGDTAALRQMFKLFSRRLAVMAVPPMALLAATGGPAFAFVFGDSWRTAGEFTQVMALMLAVQFVVNPLSQTLMLLELQYWQAASDGVRLILVVAGFGAAEALNLSAMTAVWIYSLVMLLSYVGTYLLCTWALRTRPQAPRCDRQS